MFDTLIHHPEIVQWGRIAIAPLTLLFLVICGCLVNKLRLDVAAPPKPHNAIDMSRWQIPEHQHVVDFERSPMTVLDDGQGTIVARCAYNGCPLTVTIGRDVSRMQVETKDRTGVDWEAMN